MAKSLDMTSKGGLCGKHDRAGSNLDINITAADSVNGSKVYLAKGH